MNNSPKMHRPTANIAAVLMILSQILIISASLSAVNDNPNFYSLISLISNTLITALLAVILFRGRKDVAAGVVFLIALMAPLLFVGLDLLSVLTGFDLVLYAAINALSGLVLVVFRGLSAGECLSRGKISAGGGRVLLWMLPILSFGFESAAHMLLCLYDGMNVDEMMLGTLVYEIPQWVGPILMGVSISIPEKADN